MTLRLGTCCGLATAVLLCRSVRADEPRATTPPARPVSDSVERVIDRIEKEKDPCREAKEKGVPCFPVSVERRRPDASVRQSLYEFRPDGRPSPNRPPTVDEMSSHFSGGRPENTPIANVYTFDPVCAVKSGLKNLKGKNDVYYLYRLRDVQGVRVALYDRRLDAKTFQGDVEFLGQFTGECEALAAYRREERNSAPAPEVAKKLPDSP